MQIISTYSVKIKMYNHIFKETVSVYRDAVDFLVKVCLKEWRYLCQIEQSLLRQQQVERLCHRTKKNAEVKYLEFDQKFYKFPSYLRRSAINEALGMVSSYESRLASWESSDPKSRGRKPSTPRVGISYPCMYRTVMYKQTDTYEARLKVYIRKTWDWITVSLRKSDVDYINRHCSTRKQCAPTLRRRGKEWFLDFPFEEKVKLSEKDVRDQTVVAVDLGIHTAATVSVIRADGTILGRHFCKLSKETDRLIHSVNRIKKAQQHGNRRMPRLWARANGINHDIAAKTADFIMGIATRYHADIIVFEHLERSGRKRGSKKQRLHLWRSQEVQAIVTQKMHREGGRIRRVCAWGTSRLAFDGSGIVLRGKKANLPSYSVCRFQNGKIYNCDLSASYNIGARYFIREILKSLNESLGLALKAKVPSVAKRSTCTFSTLIRMNAVLASL